MSLIDGPKKINKPNNQPAPKSMMDVAKGMVGATGVRQLENLTGVRFDPAPTYLFYVEISGLIVGLFTEVSGIGGSRKIETIQEGGLNDAVHNLPGQVEFNRITFKRGMTVSNELWNWFNTGIYDFKVKRLNLSIIQGASGQSVMSLIPGSGGYGVVKRWNVVNAYPASWKLSDLNVNDVNSVAIESMEIVHEGISVDPKFGLPMSPISAVSSLM
ncbi:MAG: phage tail protein [Anaerolineaceae bacterium]|nr:phage tail protein [Anaerolineaceae bacterium]